MTLVGVLGRFTARVQHRSGLEVYGAGVTASAGKAMGLSIRPTARARKTLVHDGSLVLKVTITFTPTGGKRSRSSTEEVTVTRG